MYKAGERGGSGGGGGNTWGPDWLGGGGEILIKHLVIVHMPVMCNHLIVLGPDHGSRRP